ncbi:hypothetical protein LCGC14_1494520 [marine sediment metagenome]|uniref:Uncharacterized protein n=2 Tax=root TaxID=1 RepID=A0A0F9J6D5_9ZZZZ|nr:MAG: hypothetical protein LCMAC202_00850 [Marseillevirus LCMAC202]
MDHLDLKQLATVLAEIDTPKSPLESGWGDLADILTEIKDNITLKNKTTKVLKWINDHPDHTYPKKIKGWINTLRSQFCPRGGAIESTVVVDHMIRLGILNVVEDTRSIRHKIISTDRVSLNRKRCRNEEFDKHRKRHKFNDMMEQVNA